MASLGCPAGQRATKYTCRKRRKASKARKATGGHCAHTKKVAGRTVPVKGYKFAKGKRCPVKAKG